MRQAAFFQSLEDGKVRCLLCPHSCLLTPGKRGVCRTRRNVNGILCSLNYCRPVSTALDPIEKKPLYHFHPGSRILSTGPNGCTFRCSFCQNSPISQELVPCSEVTVSSLCDAVEHSKSLGIAYTYSEPFIWYETILEVGTAVKKRGYRNVMVTNGFMEKEPLRSLLNVIDAMNVDIKSIRPEFYKRICKGALTPVLRACEIVRKSCHLEITNLVIPGINDSEKDIGDLASYIASNLGPDTPLHLSRYFPRFRMSLPPTPLTVMERAREVARQKLHHVYVGNTGADDANTYCPACGELVIERRGYNTVLRGLGRDRESRVVCSGCATRLNVVA